MELISLLIKYSCNKSKYDICTKVKIMECIIKIGDHGRLKQADGKLAHVKGTK